MDSITVVRTTLTLDEDVAAKIKAHMKRSGRSLKQTVNALLRDGLMSARKPPRKRLVVRPVDVGPLLMDIDCTSRVMALLDEADER